MRRLVLAALAVLFCTSVQAQLVAERVTVDNAAKRLFSGPDTTGGVGDWYLSNGVVEAIVDDASFNADLLARGAAVPNQYLLSPTGGTLIDLGLVGKNNDELTQLFTVANLSPQNSLFYTKVHAEATAGEASIVAEGFVILDPFSTAAKPALPVRTVYSVGPGQPWINISTTVLNGAGTVLPLFNLTDAITVIGSIVPFAPFPGRGFNHPPLVLTPEGVAASLGVFPYVVLPGQLGPENGVADTVTNAKAGEVAYGLLPGTVTLDPDGAGPLPPVAIPNPALLGLTSHTVVGVGNVFDPAKSPTVPAGGTFTYARRVLVTDRNDVASVTNAVFSSLAGSIPVGTVAGDIDADGAPDVQATLLVTGKIPQLFGNTPVPITAAKTDASGKFALVLPQGDYSVVISSPEHPDAPASLHVAAGTNSVTMPTLGAAGSVSFRVVEGSTPVPARLTFIGVGNGNPDFSRQYSSFLIDPKTGQPLGNAQAGARAGAPALNYVITGDGTGRQTIRPGTFRVIASRGFEYSVDAKQIEVKAGSDTHVDFTLRRVVDTSGFASADFHIHSARSFDSAAPLEDRIRSYVADGVELLVSTDHNFITDFAPVINSLNLGAWARSIVGNELTTFLPTPQYPQAFGHHNVFPQVVDPTAPRRGAVATEYVNAATMYDRARAQHPDIKKTVQLNHPRAGVLGLTSIGLFNVIGYDPTKPMPSILLDKSLLGTGTTNLDFDAMEIYNGNSLAQFLEVRNDWFSLLDQGIVKTATAVSDSHKIVVEWAGYPRSFVATATDDPSKITDDMVTAAVAARNVVGTSGPFIRFTIDGSPIGSLVHPKTWLGSRAEISVAAPAWVPVSEVRVYANGRLLKKFDATTTPPVQGAPADPTSAGGVERFHTAFRISPARDTYYTVEAGIPLPDVVDTNGDGVVDAVANSSAPGIPQPAVGGVYNDIAPGFVPIAFTNPIFVDRNGNGKFDPPGLDPGRVRKVAPPPGALAAAAETDDDACGQIMLWQSLRVTDAEISRFWQTVTPR